MTQYKRIGIDTSKAVFKLHGIDQQDRPVLRINLRRAQMISFFRKVTVHRHRPLATGGITQSIGEQIGQLPIWRDL